MKNFPYRQVIQRYMVFSWLFALLGLIIVGKAAYLMFGERTKWAEISKSCVRNNITIGVNRGDIISADGQLLATYVPEYRIYLDYNIYNPNKKDSIKQQHKKDATFLATLDSVSTGLNKILPDQSKEWFKDRLYKGYEQRKRHWRIYPRNITYLQFKEIKQLPYFNRSRNFSGLHVDTINRIDKPFGTLASRTLGEVDRETGRGSSGLQLRFDSLLRGTPGLVHKVRVMKKNLPVVDRQPVNGANIHTTLDVVMQDFCENALVKKLKEIDGIYGVAILMEVKTGDIKALVNMQRCDDGEYRDLRNFAVNQLMQPGSVFKTISITAALEAGKCDLNTTVDCSAGAINVGGYTIKDASRKSNKVINLREVLGYSSNVGVIKIITRGYGGSKATEQQFYNDVMKLGIAEDMQLDIPGGMKARIPNPKTYESWSASSMASMSIGYSTQVPPISLLAFYNGIANGGRMMRPRLVTHITRDGEIIETIAPRAIKERMCSPKTAHDITECLKWVVSDGLGGAAGSPNFLVAGKTGTARVQQKDHSGEYLITFAGFFPADNPQYSCVVSMRKAGSGSGGGMCGPVFKQIAEFVMTRNKQYTLNDHIDSLHSIPPALDFTNLLYANKTLSNLGFVVPSNWNPDNIANPIGSVNVVDKHAKIHIEHTDRNKMPDLTGMGPRDALYLLEKMHLKVKLQGIGKVVAQSLPAGHAITPGQHITLTLGCALNHKPLISKPATNKPDSLKSLNKDSLRADSLKKANNTNNNQHSIQI